jgi:hypothetical protein
MAQERLGTGERRFILAIQQYVVQWAISEFKSQKQIRPTVSTQTPHSKFHGDRFCSFADDMWEDGRTITTSPLCVPFMPFLQDAQQSVKIISVGF